MQRENCSLHRSHCSILMQKLVENAPFGLTGTVYLPEGIIQICNIIRSYSTPKACSDKFLSGISYMIEDCIIEECEIAGEVYLKIYIRHLIENSPIFLLTLTQRVFCFPLLSSNFCLS